MKQPKSSLTAQFTTNLRKVGTSILALGMMFLSFQIQDGFSQGVEAASNEKAMMYWNNTTKTYLNPRGYQASDATNGWQGSKLVWAGLTWRILNTAETGYGKNDATGGVLMMSDDSTLGKTEFSKAGSNNYSGSDLETYIDTAQTTRMVNNLEQSATVTTTKQEPLYDVDGDEFTDNITAKKWFSPTAKMLSTTSYGYPDVLTVDATRVIDHSTNAWLSSASEWDANQAAFLYGNGELTNNQVDAPHLAIAATQIDPAAILFVSDSTDGKQSGTIGKDALTTVSTTTSGTYKTTLKDTNQKVEVVSAEADAAGLATITYHKKGAGTTLSAIITDSAGENIISYGQLATVDGTDLNNRTVTVQLPTDFFTNNYKLKIFSEVYHADSSTDYASEDIDTAVTQNTSVGNVTINYKDAAGIDQIKVFEDVASGTDLTADPDFAAILAIDVQGYRKATPFWSFSDSLSEAALQNVTKAFSATANYIKTYDVTIKYRDANHQVVNMPSITVDTGTNLINAGKLPALPTAYQEVNGVTYRYNTGGNHWVVSSGSGTISNVTSDIVVEATTTKQLQTTITYRNATNPETFETKDYWIDEHGSLLKNDPVSGNAYLPTLEKQIEGYRIKDETNIWKSNQAANTLSNIVVPSVIEAEYVKNWNVSFQSWDGTVLPNGSIYIDDGAMLETSQIPTAPNRFLHTFASWNVDTTKPVSENLVIKAQYTAQELTIHMENKVESKASNEVKELFKGMDHEAMNKTLKGLYKPGVTSGNEVYRDVNGFIVYLKYVEDYDALQAGNVGEYTVVMMYKNPENAAQVVRKENVLKVTETIPVETPIDVSSPKTALDMMNSYLNIAIFITAVGFVGLGAYKKRKILHK